jgi:hypothetical protein
MLANRAKDRYHSPLRATRYGQNLLRRRAWTQRIGVPTDFPFGLLKYRRDKALVLGGAVALDRVPDHFLLHSQFLSSGLERTYTNPICERLDLVDDHSAGKVRDRSRHSARFVGGEEDRHVCHFCEGG